MLAYIITGVVANDDMAEKIRAAAQRFAPDKDSVIINRVQVAGPNQVNLRLRVAEVARSVTKQLGFNWEAVVSPGSFSFGLATGRAAFLAGLIPNPGAKGDDELPPEAREQAL